MATENEVITFYSARASRKSGQAASEKGSREQALLYYEEALKGFKIINDVEGQQEVEHLIDHENSKVRLDKSLQCARDFCDKGRAEAQNELRQQALKHYKEALKAFEAFKDLIHHEKSARAFCNNGPAAAQEELRKKALKHYEEAQAEGEKKVEALIHRETRKQIREANLEYLTVRLEACKIKNDATGQHDAEKLIRREEAMILGDAQMDKGSDKSTRWDKSKKHIYTAIGAYRKAIEHYKDAGNHSAQAAANKLTAYHLTQESFHLSAAKYGREADRLSALTENPQSVGGADGDSKAPAAR